MTEFKTPVLFLVFNRPDTTRLVFEKIREAKPKQLFISADGPREEKAGEKEKCELVRKIATNVDWECEVKTLFRETNLGGPMANSGGISWFFSNVEEGIILEDDCLPHPFFFKYCSSLLERYRHNETVKTIGGFNYGIGKQRANSTYYFTVIPGTWGWATWKRVWDDFNWDLMSDDEKTKRDVINKYYKNKVITDYFLGVFNQKHWDYIFLYSILKHNGLCITPNVNLVKNIGFGEGASHTTNSDSPLNYVLIGDINPDAKIKHPYLLKMDRKKNSKIFNKAFFHCPSNSIFVTFIDKLKGKIYYHLKKNHIKHEK